MVQGIASESSASFPAMPHPSPHIECTTFEPCSSDLQFRF